MIQPPAADSPAQTRPRRRATAALITALAGLIMALWWLGTPSGLAGKADAIGYAVCHRIVDRSFHVDGVQLPLCVRCTGMYMGVMISFLVLVAGRRGKAAQFAPRRVLIVLAIFVVVMGLDGLNSYLHLFPGYEGPYEPQNWLRLITGSLTGVAMITLLLPVFSVTMWARPATQPPLRGLRELAALLLVIGLADALVLLGSAPALIVFGYLSALGPVLILTMVWAVLFVSLTRRENTAHRAADLIVPLLAGLALTFLLIGSIDLLRYQLTGTWAGFDFSQFG